MHDIFYTPSMSDCTLYNAFHHNAGNVALGKCVFLFILHFSQCMDLSCTEQTEKTDAAVLSRNESSFSLSAESFVQLRFLLLPRLLIRPPALPEPNLELHRRVLRWE